MAGHEGEPRCGEPTPHQRTPTEQHKPQQEGGNGAPGIQPTLNERAQPPPESGALGDREGKKVYTLKDPSEEQLANVNQEVLKFGCFVFAREWGRELTAQGFVLSAQLALQDLENGIDTETGQPIKGLFASLTHQPPMVYHLLDREIPKIGDLFFDPEFAREIRTFWNKVDTHRRQEIGGIYSSNSDRTK